ncbi:DNA gyrase inhibitor YacG [Gallaecimonas sp. GXIMD4217]|uniref:DNA gyrase inhibitor YacG n=1 Tax=Gallaecimonas sp. GXIMD4217 TaxID=3131927 RepID=UPI00311AEFDC
MEVKCPICGKSVPWNEKSAFRPFCSKRCQLIDLGEWASEERRIPSEEEAPSQEEAPKGYEFD